MKLSIYMLVALSIPSLTWAQNPAATCMDQLTPTPIAQEITEYFYATELHSGELILKEAKHIDVEVSLGKEMAHCLTLLHKQVIQSFEQGSQIDHLLSQILQKTFDPQTS